MSVTRQAQKNKWDEAIADANTKIGKLKLSIATFEDRKRTGDPWPDQVQDLDSMESRDHALKGNRIEKIAGQRAAKRRRW